MRRRSRGLGIGAREALFRFLSALPQCFQQIYSFLALQFQLP